MKFRQLIPGSNVTSNHKATWCKRNKFRRNLIWLSLLNGRSLAWQTQQQREKWSGTLICREKCRIANSVQLYYYIEVTYYCTSSSSAPVGSGREFMNPFRSVLVSFRFPTFSNKRKRVTVPLLLHVYNVIFHQRGLLAAMTRKFSNDSNKVDWQSSKRRRRRLFLKRI